MTASGPANDSRTCPPTVDVSWLAEHLDDPDLIVLDTAAGDVRIPGARRFDLDGVMSDADSPIAHTLPSAVAFTEACQALGIHRRSRVVVYDPRGIFSSPRARWMLITAGHPCVSILDGGLPAWIAAGHATEPWDESPSPTPGDFVAQPFGSAVVPRDEVERVLEDGSATVLDARSRGRFAGIEPEPREGLRPGHMPGSVNLPFTELLDDGRLRPLPELRARFEEAAGTDGPVVVSCGSGVTACVIGLVAELLDRPVRLYDGSWSEWGLPDGPPVARGEEAGVTRSPE
ncbi:sulfurtransferase [Microbacterium caowuchunii]|uniref:sulfurtransferase n=1 Tax=Microbacterium caowuchunii TaxID=2614638 RepID=UPI00124922B7|nr:sulfurtransferase [Microbacterium caowuchunii]QEV99420.1 sulfurtransferase [Microbacterium caowuchunii]